MEENFRKIFKGKATLGKGQQPIEIEQNGPNETQIGRRMVKNVELETSGKQQNDVPALEAIKGNSLKSDGS